MPRYTINYCIRIARRPNGSLLAPGKRPSAKGSCTRLSRDFISAVRERGLRHRENCAIVLFFLNNLLPASQRRSLKLIAVTCQLDDITSRPVSLGSLFLLLFLASSSGDNCWIKR